MADLIAARDWLTVCQLPPYAHELNPVVDQEPDVLCGGPPAGLDELLPEQGRTGLDALGRHNLP